MERDYIIERASRTAVAVTLTLWLGGVVSFGCDNRNYDNDKEEIVLRADENYLGRCSFHNFP